MPPPGFRKAVVAALPGTLCQIIVKSGMRKGTVVRWPRILQDEGAIHVSGWVRSEAAGPIKRVYTDGPGVNVPCTLKRLPGAKYNKKYRKTHAELIATYNDRRRARYHAARAAKTPQTWLSALGGPHA